MKFNRSPGLAAVDDMSGIFMRSSSPGHVPAASRVALKLLHVRLFAALSACLLLAFTQGPWDQIGWWQLYGVVALVAGGSARVGDFLLDCVGIALLLAVHRLMTREGRGWCSTQGHETGST